MSDSQPPLGPWSMPSAETEAPFPPAPPVQTPASPLNEIVWGLISTALLAAWLAWQAGPVWAVAGVVGVFVHEYGHVLAMNALGAGPGRIRIIPFLGGAATMARPPTSDFKSVLISLAGPLFGLLAAIPFVLLARYENPVWLSGAFFVGIINLINLAPAPPLDGSKALGPALARISPMLERVALVLVGAGAVYWAITTGNWLFGAFVGIATLGALRTGVPRFVARPLTGLELAASIGLWLVALVLCASVVVATSSPGILLGHRP